MFHVLESNTKSASNVKSGSVTDEQMAPTQAARGI